jgi:hypothetical protein
MNWLLYALLTVACWGVYGIFLHNGTLAIGDPVNGRTQSVPHRRAGVLPRRRPRARLRSSLDQGRLRRLLELSLARDSAGRCSPARSARLARFGVLLAFGAKGTPAVVMSIIFAGAPIVNALGRHRSAPARRAAGGPSSPNFILGIVLAAGGAGDGQLLQTQSRAGQTANARRAVRFPYQRAKLNR